MTNHEDRIAKLEVNYWLIYQEEEKTDPKKKTAAGKEKHVLQAICGPHLNWTYETSFT